MYTIANLTHAPIEFALAETVSEARAAGEAPYTYTRGGDKMEGKPSERSCWEVKWSDDARHPSTVQVTDDQYKQLSAQRGFAALVASGDLRVTKD